MDPVSSHTFHTARANSRTTRSRTRHVQAVSAAPAHAHRDVVRLPPARRVRLRPKGQAERSQRVRRGLAAGDDVLRPGLVVARRPLVATHNGEHPFAVAPPLVVPVAGQKHGVEPAGRGVEGQRLPPQRRVNARRALPVAPGLTEELRDQAEARSARILGDWVELKNTLRGLAPSTRFPLNCRTPPLLGAIVIREYVPPPRSTCTTRR